MEQVTALAINPERRKVQYTPGPWNAVEVEREGYVWNVQVVHLDSAPGGGQRAYQLSVLAPHLLTPPDLTTSGHAFLNARTTLDKLADVLSNAARPSELGITPSYPRYRGAGRVGVPRAGTTCPTTPTLTPHVPEYAERNIKHVKLRSCFGTTRDARLVSRSVMSAALKTLTDSADHWVFLVFRSSLDWETGAPQTAGLVIKTGDAIELSNDLDLRLIKSKRARVFLHWSDGGTVLTDLTLRRYSVIAPSPLVRQHMSDFKKNIKPGAASRLITPRFITFLLFWPFLFVVAAFIQVTIQDDEYRHYLFGPLDAEPVEPDFPEWYNGFLVARLLYVLGLLAALAIGYVRLKSGGLRVWPNALTKMSLLGILYRLRTEGLRVENLRQITTGVIIGVLIAVMTFWFAN